MELGEAMGWVLVVVGVLLGVLSLYMKRKPFSEESDAPYKLEPAEQLAVSDQPKKRGRPVGSKNKKRRYTKRSAYWNQFRAKRKYTKRSRYWRSKELQEKIEKARQAYLSK